MKTILSALVVAAAILGALLATPGPALAQDDVIYACITKTTGQLRIVSTAGQCKSNEASIYWNQTGPQGPQGEQGPQGPQGPPSPPEPSNGQTRLLFPFVSNQAGFDTGISIANTTADPFGTAQMSGTCTLSYYGSTTGGGAAPSAQTSGVVPAGQMLIFTASTGGNLGIVGVPGFQGYIIALCNFPLAHGFYFVSDVGAQRIAHGGEALVLSSTRTTDIVESRGK